MEAKARTIESYLTAGGQCPFEQWMDKLRGDTIHGRIIDRLEKVKRGNLGDWKALGEGANELRTSEKDTVCISDLTETKLSCLRWKERTVQRHRNGKEELERLQCLNEREAMIRGY